MQNHLKFLSLEGLYIGLEKGKEIILILNLVITILQEIIQLKYQIIWVKTKITQLSLLSGKSNS